MLTPSQATITLSPQDHIQAIKHHPEFQYCLALWKTILRKEAEGLRLTDEEEALKWAPRSGFNVEAELEATRYGLLSLAEREHAMMTEAELAWRDCSPVLDWKNKAAEIRIPLWWTLAAIDKTVARIVRIYKNRIGLADAKYSGPPLNCADCVPQLRFDTLTLRFPLAHPVEDIDTVVRHLVRTHKATLGLASPQRIRGPKVDPWLVYRLHQQEKLSLLSITHRLFGTSGSPAYDDDVKRKYERVRRAYEFALAALDHIGQEYAEKST